MGEFQVEDVANRPIAQFPVDIWGQRFMNHCMEDALSLEVYNKEIEALKEEVKALLKNNSGNMATKISLINAMDHLGVSYLYDQEIRVLLDLTFGELSSLSFQIDYDLCQTAAFFRIFRQHGYNFPSDVFDKFTDEKGKFRETLKRDVDGMMSLYEAAHLRVHGEEILEEALIFTTGFLKSIAESCEEARRALKHPLQYTMLKVQTPHFISIYERDQSHNETLLRLAKMDFNRLQLLHRYELNQHQKWWKSFNLATKLPYIRDRSVESHFVANGVYFEPQYSLGRLLLAKVALVVIVLDDTYDAYGTYHELQLLTEAFERWDLGATDQLSDNLKTVYEFVINAYDDFTKEMTKTGKMHAAQFAKQVVMDLIICFMEEVKWREAEYTPSYDEYMRRGRITGLAPIMLISSLMGMDEIVDDKPFQVIRKASKPIKACELFCRLTNDIYSHEAEKCRGDGPSAVECYMKEHGISREETVEIFERMLEDAWKDINEAILSVNYETDPSDDNGKLEELPDPVLKRCLNLCRMVNVLYKGNDGFTHPEQVIRDHITLLYDTPFSI